MPRRKPVFKSLEQQCRERKLEREAERANRKLASYEQQQMWKLDLADRRFAVEIVRLVFVEMGMTPGRFHRQHFMRLINWKPRH